MDEKANINSPLIDEVRSVDDEIDTNEEIADEGIEINGSPINDEIRSDNNPSTDQEKSDTNSCDTVARNIETADEGIEINSMHEEKSDTNSCDTVAANIEERDIHVNMDITLASTKNRTVTLCLIIVTFILLPVIPLLLHKRTPQFWIESASIRAIEFSHVFNRWSQIVPVAYKITAEWHIRFGVTNPPSGWSYGNIAAIIYYQEEPLWVTMITRFHDQQHADFVVLGAHLSSPVTFDLPLGTSIISDILSGSSKDFSVRLHGNMKQDKFEKSNNPRRGSTSSFSVLCQLDVKFLSKSELIGDVRSGMCKTKLGTISLNDDD
ncbi:hypothetical protein ACH5RR_031147 [Cinchona calisaya]|uniref:Uncharacterized protein n=1 Tax=Cinchona calisaya TaxID=153742 RepID=A0ABD2YIN3_9GENT